MITHNDSSGRIAQPSLLSGFRPDVFVNFVLLSQSDHNVILQAQRYGKFFVLKAIAPGLKHHPYQQQLLRKEFDLALQLSHPNIIRVYSLEVVEPYGLCIVMDHIAGRTLDRYLAHAPSLASRKRVAVQLLSALSYCHHQKVIHRDLKPANILVSNNGDNVCLIDFGLSDADYYAILKEPAFSRSYASPEQLRGEPLDCRTDIYSFGLLLRQMFPKSHRRVARRCCNPQRERRYHSVDAVGRALFSPWRHLLWLVPALVLVLSLAWGAHSYRHTNVDEFQVLAPTGQTLRCRIVNSQAHILGGLSPQGRLAIPSSVRHRLRSYPVVAIADEAFFREHAITHLQLPEGLLQIGDRAFCECTSLTDTLVLPVSLRIAGRESFCSTAITHLVLRSRFVQSSDPDYSHIFFSCFNLRQVLISSTADSIGVNFFFHSHAQSVVVPSHWTSIPSAAFSTIINMQHIVLPQRLKTLQASSFYSNSIQHLVLPDSLQEVQAYAFRWARCRYLEFGSALQYIGPCALANMQWLDTLVIRAPQPPQCPLDIYDGAPPSNAVLMVPAASVQRYRDHPSFSCFNILPLPASAQ